MENAAVKILAIDINWLKIWSVVRKVLDALTERAPADETFANVINDCLNSLRGLRISGINPFTQIEVSTLQVLQKNSDKI